MTIKHFKYTLAYRGVCLFVHVENRMEFLEKLQRVCSQVSSSGQVHPILTSPGSVRLTVGNWSLTSSKEGEITIHNADGRRVSGFFFFFFFFFNWRARHSQG